jgi:hypothetical protein
MDMPAKNIKNIAMSNYSVSMADVNFRRAM